jgi:hypothetical protein
MSGIVWSVLIFALSTAPSIAEDVQSKEQWIEERKQKLGPEQYQLLLEACRLNADSPEYQWFQGCPGWEKSAEEVERRLRERGWRRK